MTEKKMHQAIGMVNDDFTEIMCYVHERHNVGQCPWCDYMRVQHITNEFLWRMDNCGTKIKRLHMWSLGTSMTDTIFNRNVLLARWRQFSKVMGHNKDWSPVFRIVEVGRRGFLHLHVVAIRYVKHSEVLKAWRYQSGEKSNVHVSPGSKFMNPHRLAGYLLKYLSKNSSAYRFLGVFYGLHSSRSRYIGRGEFLRYGGICYFGYETDAYENKDPVQKDLNNCDVIELRND